MEQSVEKQMDVIRRRAVDIITEKELEGKIKRAIDTGKPLKVKLGLDPNRPDIHIGHMVVIDKLRDFQDLGHEVVLIVGTFTGFIGDPSERDSARPQISLEEVVQNAGTYFDQIKAVLDPDKTQIVSNADWLMPLNFADILGIASKVTVAQIIERDDFQTRYREGKPISLQEFLYPLAQAYDSVAVESDVELGGTDQKFNCLVGRDLQRAFGQEPQCVLTTPLLVGTDGVKKMSKSLDNYIGITHSPEDMFGKVMSIPDSALIEYFKLATYEPMEWIEQTGKALESNDVHPMELKKKLARIILTRYHGEEGADKGEAHFTQVFSKRELPDDMYRQQNRKRINIVEILRQTRFADTNSEAKRLIKQGAVKFKGETITDFDTELEIENGDVIKVGKRRFAELSVLHNLITIVLGEAAFVTLEVIKDNPSHTKYTVFFNFEPTKSPDGAKVGDIGPSFVAKDNDELIRMLRNWIVHHRDDFPEFEARLKEYDDKNM